MTATSDRWSCDTSVAIAALDPNHEAHGGCGRVAVELRAALAGHAAFETYAVLTGLPVPLRLSGAQAGDVLACAFPDECWLDGDDLGRLRPGWRHSGSSAAPCTTPWMARPRS